MEVYELESCVRGHHVYRRVWRATVDEQLECKPERATTNIGGRTVQSIDFKIGDF